MKKVFYILSLTLIACSSPNEVEEDITPEVLEFDTTDSKEYKVFWHYEDDFSADEKKKLKKWINTVYVATIETLGQYPFNLHVTFHRSDRNTAVTFGHTRRGKRQHVHFYVNPSFELEDFMTDWIAPHEISHLSMPFVGKEAKWYAEGYATYLSRRIMMNMGFLNEAEFDSMYYHKIGNTMMSYCSSTKTFAEVSDSLLDQNEYGDMYWGSTSFFMTSDSLLQEKHNMEFTDLVIQYQACCRLKDKNDIHNVMSSYDEIIGDSLFTNLLWRYQNLPCIKVMEGY